MFTIKSGMATGFIVCRFDLDKKFNKLVGCLAFDSDSNLSHSTVDNGSLEYFIFWETRVSYLL